MNVEWPKISIVTPSYNQGQFLESTIISVLGQGYPNLEYIIMDGGSEDNSVDIIKKYSSRLAYWESQKDQGQSHAINKGFAKATGKILAWLNSDDMLLPLSLFTMVKRVNKDGIGIYFGNCIHFEENDQNVMSWGSNVQASAAIHALEKIDFIIQPSSFWTKQTWQLVGELREDMRFAFDWEWFLRAKVKGVSLNPIADCLAMYRIHKAHKSGVGGEERQEEILAVYREHSPKYAYLYDMLRKEEFRFDSMRARLLRKWQKMIDRRHSTATMLKEMRRKKYKAFSVNEIEEALKML